MKAHLARVQAAEREDRAAAELATVAAIADMRRRGEI
jgi:hypothetical protein